MPPYYADCSHIVRTNYSERAIWKTGQRPDRVNARLHRVVPLDEELRIYLQINFLHAFFKGEFAIYRGLQKWWSADKGNANMPQGCSMLYGLANAVSIVDAESFEQLSRGIGVDR